jgi:hypothetical protein
MAKPSPDLANPAHALQRLWARVAQNKYYTIQGHYTTVARYLDMISHLLPPCAMNAPLAALNSLTR